MEQVYAVCDRRCRTQTALDKLAKLQRHVQRFPALGDTLKKLFAPTLDKALTFLDDKLLPSTSNAVERGNRRYRKMQKQVYRVRTQGKPRQHLCYVYASLSRLGFRGLPEKLFIVFEGVIGFSTAKKPTALMMHWWNGGRGGV